MNLVVQQGGEKIGLLCGSSDRGVVFSYDTEYLGSPQARALSHSLALRPEEFSSKECLPFFSGLLPDGEMKRKISEFLHVSESSTLKLLEALGGECAGSITLSKEEEKEKEYCAASLVPEELPFESKYRKLVDSELSAMVGRMDYRPLLIGASDLRLSLAGAQQKLALARFEGDWYLPLGGSPSTHILKPSRYPYPDLAVNEYICMQVASLCGLPVPSTEVFLLEGTPVYVIERYDRTLHAGKSLSIERIHQEDACQALGIMPDRKYEFDGGPSFPQIVSLIHDIAASPILGMRTILGLAIFNFLAGNCDAHGKNLSFLYPGQGKDGKRSETLAPLYDLVSTTVYEDLSSKLSMKIGGEYRIERIRRNHFLTLGKDVQVGRPYMEKLLDTMILSVSNALDKIALLAEIPMMEPLVSSMRLQLEHRVRQISE
ncbi:MAG: type II toxin-antitoxin system HipA family toxin [Sphaerochaeta sp.]|nr:type II toxin-antitoxin system HipA family toxin [Sphaerochaeta sp.]